MHEEVLNKHWKNLLAKENVLNVAVANKFVNGADTGVPAIVVYVSKKRPAVSLKAGEMIPEQLDGVPTDVVELAPTKWTAGKTSISQLHPADQRRRLGIIEKPAARPKEKLHQNLLTSSGHCNWTPWASAIQDQLNCGACLAFDVTGVWEVCIRIQLNDPNYPIKISEAHLFFCCGGTCGGGATVDVILNQALKGVCLEECLPYKDQDQACGAGICDNWWEHARKLMAWNRITDPVEIKTLLDREPLVATMAVHQSFFNYTDGIYKNLGPQDPIIGYHAIGCLGYDDPENYRIIRNSWGLGWAPDCVIDGEKRPGYCLIDAGELDPEMEELVPSNDPVPNPGPAPAPTPTPPVPHIITTQLPEGVVGEAYSAALAADGASPPYSWFTDWGEPPPGLTLSAEGVLSGVPTKAGIFPAIYGCRDSVGSTAGTQINVLISSKSTCKVGNSVTAVLNLWPRVAGRKGRFRYLNVGK